MFSNKISSHVVRNLRRFPASIAKWKYINMVLLANIILIRNGFLEILRNSEKNEVEATLLLSDLPKETATKARELCFANKLLLGAIPKSRINCFISRNCSSFEFDRKYE